MDLTDLPTLNPPRKNLGNRVPAAVAASLVADQQCDDSAATSESLIASAAIPIIS